MGMYTKKEFEEQLETLYNYYKEPIHKLVERSGLTRPTVTKFLEGNTLRSYNQDKLIEAVIKMNEEAQEKRRSLQQRGKRIIQLELELADEEHIEKSESA
ncbi:MULTISPECIES: hypothetical protein [Aquimarina]|uniref:Helix-turn-helix domain-containing protein n=1 Tax=Aquimarina algicola TaxID=2589995 RepID=A0A504JH96_9FLAO|nr:MULTISPECIES: hypothetical protein [Aquimarina]TPN87168.1 hypothetical protein FHK87_06140 [Aquimarina algicola]